MRKIDFVRDVTSDFVARGVFSERAFKRVLESHMNQNAHHLSRQEMTSLANKLAQDLDVAVD
eukprot:m.156961 g.156961  ORF g.156961 m.156961 type:complete len:62 (+) comp24702_c1_seq2:252-437(+)